jgi:hypothetical protein
VRPTKKSDSRSGDFEGESVEVDAIPVATLRAMVRERIERHIDLDLLREVQRQQKEDRALLADAYEYVKGLRSTR